MMVGIGTKMASLHADSFTNLLGRDKHSWGLSHKGLTWHDGQSYRYTLPFRENVPTTVGLLFDGIEGTLTFYKDGECLGVAFKNLNEIKEPLYPVACSTAAKTQMILVSMRRDFVSLQDMCRAVIVKRVRCKEDLDKLYLPPSIGQYLKENVYDEKNSEPTKCLCGCGC